MKKFLFGILLTIFVLLLYKQCTHNATTIINDSSGLIQEQLKNVSKLVVSEGNFSEVMNYKKTKAVFGNMINLEKKALVVVNAKVSISYDLKKLEYRLDEATKTIEITSIPDYEVDINPDLKYYDIQADFLNPFEAEDYNNIKESVNASLTKRIEKSTLLSNAQNRLISELSKFYILTESLGWKLVYKNEQLSSENNFKKLLL